MSQWQEIFSVDTWEILTGKKMVKVVGYKSESLNYIKADIPADLGDTGHTLLDTIYELIKFYHQIDKTNLSFFEKRIDLLKQIEAATQGYIDYRGTDLQSKKDKKIVGMHPNMAPKLGDFVDCGLGSIDIWIQSLHKRCQKKVKHLNALQLYLADHPDYNQEGLKNMIVNAPHYHGQLYPGVLIEHIDLYHRQSEFACNDISKPGYRDDKAIPMNYAFNQWLVSQSETPFFLWLEDHAITTAHRVLSPNYQRPNCVEYNLSGKEIVNIQSLKSDKLSDENKGEISDTDSSDESVLTPQTPRTNRVVSFDSKEMKSSFPGCWKPYTPIHSVAFVWDKSNKEQFITHPHKPGKYHHSSLVEGGDVRCAGMWTVTNGKVTYLSNSSGHYRTSTLGFFKLVNYLNKKGVLGDNVKIADLTNSNEKSKNLDLNDYMFWAKEQPVVKKYLQKDKSKELHSSVKTSSGQINSMG